MDPLLQDKIRPELDPNEVIEAIVRLQNKAIVPVGLRVISQFEEIITCRVRRGDVQAIYDSPQVVSFKAARLLTSGAAGFDESIDLDFSEINRLTEETGSVTGKGVVIGIIDWGGDFAHVDFLNLDGTTRFLALWDQTTPATPKSPAPFGYGSAYRRPEINAALKTAHPYQSLGYHPGKGGPKGGSHGTHVMGIAAGNGRSGVWGVAPEADIVFVHLGSGDVQSQMNLGDSVKLLEAIDFIRRTAGDKPLVINASVGRHGGSHDGRSLVEMAMDFFLENRLNTAICQSTGNYYQTDTHASGTVYPGRTETIIFTTDKADVTPNELEIWYPGRDVLLVEIEHADSKLRARCPINEDAELTVGGQVVGRVYHRSKEPNNGLNHVNLFLYTIAPFGEWKMTLYGERVVDGRFHAWIERDGGCATCQSKFRSDFADRLTTTGTICNGYNTIVVGALDTGKNGLGSFSSSGPTIDGRTKPNLLAPGVGIWSAKSSPLTQTQGGQKLIRMSGTSMASPHVTGAVALMLSAATSDVDIHTLRRLLLKNTRPLTTEAIDRFRLGSGLLNIRAAIEAMEEHNQFVKQAPARQETVAETQFAEPDPELLLAGETDDEYIANTNDMVWEITGAECGCSQECDCTHESDEWPEETDLVACDGYGEAYEHSLSAHNSYSL